MTTEQAIRIIDEHFVWLAGKRMINNTMLQKLTGALLAIVEHIGKAETEAEANVNHMTEVAAKMKQMLLLSGFSQKGINEALGLRVDFLQKWAEKAEKTKLYLQSPVVYDLLIAEARSIELLAQTDVQMVRDYAYFSWFIKRISEDDTNENRQKVLKNAEKQQLWTLENYPHLEKWFTRIDAGERVEDLKERVIFEESYRIYLEKWS